MSVKAKRIVKGVGRLEYATTAQELTQSDHPVYATFVKWCGEKKPTKRQARKFLQQYPQYREVH